MCATKIVATLGPATSDPATIEALFREASSIPPRAARSTSPSRAPPRRCRRRWDIFIMVLVLYNAVAVPLDVSFGMPQDRHIVDYLEYSVDLIFLFDIFGNFRTA